MDFLLKNFPESKMERLRVLAEAKGQTAEEYLARYLHEELGGTPDTPTTIRVEFVPRP